MRIKLIDECRQWWKLWSIWLAGVAASIAAAIVASPQLLLGLLAFVPEGWRWLAAVGTFVVVFVLPTIARLAQQPKLQEKSDGQK